MTTTEPFDCPDGARCFPCHVHGCAICGHVVLADTEDWPSRFCAEHAEPILALIEQERVAMRAAEAGRARLFAEALALSAALVEISALTFDDDNMLPGHVVRLIARRALEGSK